MISNILIVPPHLTRPHPINHKNSNPLHYHAYTLNSSCHHSGVVCNLVLMQLKKISLYTDFSYDSYVCVVVTRISCTSGSHERYLSIVRETSTCWLFSYCRGRLPFSRSGYRILEYRANHEPYVSLVT